MDKRVLFGGQPDGTPANRRSALICAALLIAFATIAWSAVSTKSPTYDEPYHALAGWTQLHRLDYRLDAEDPPLWKFLVGLPNGRDALRANFDSPNWTQQPQKQWLQWNWTTDTLFQTPGNDADRFVRRSRAMMLAVGVALGALIAFWAWRLGGAIAAIAATVLFCFDPNFLAHAPLVKNDISISLAITGLCMALWRCGQKLTRLRLLAVVLLVGVMLTVKFSGILALALVPMLLTTRAFLREPWSALGRTWTGRPGRLAIAAALTAAACIGGYAAVWLAYSCRFAPTPDPAIRLNTATLYDMGHVKEIESTNGDRAPTPAERRRPPGFFLTAMSAIEAHRLLPQSCIDGLLFTYQASLIRPQFLLGHISATGWWYYFPVAMAVKTPLATLAIVAFAAIAAATIWLRCRGQAPGSPRSFDCRWSAFCLALPAILYLLWAMHSNLNIGVRHVLPIYPLVFIACGWTVAAATRRWGRSVIAIAGILGIWLAVTALAAYPDFIAFFNRAAGGERGGIRYLADSNLDWGQDLKLLAKWQQQHPDHLIYLAYFGPDDATYYGLRYQPLLPWPNANPNAVVAISATYLQGLYLTDSSLKEYYAALAADPPMDVLGGTLYLYSLSGKNGRP